MMLDVHDLSMTLSGRKVLHSINLSISQGELVGLLGPNGAGKSTLMRVVAGQVAAQGSITLNGQNLGGLSAQARAQLLSYLPQTRVISWRMKVEDVVGLGRLPWRAPGQRLSTADREIVQDALELMDVVYLAKRLVTELSGGEQARVLAARAVAQATPFLLADEPASGLDPAHQILMMHALRQLAKQGRMVLVSLHDLTLAARWCDRLVILKDGAIAGIGIPEDIMRPDNLAEVFGITAHFARDSNGLILAPIGLTEGVKRL